MRYFSAVIYNALVNIVVIYNALIDIAVIYNALTNIAVGPNLIWFLFFYFYTLNVPYVAHLRSRYEISRCGEV